MCRRPSITINSVRFSIFDRGNLVVSYSEEGPAMKTLTECVECMSLLESS